MTFFSFTDSGFTTLKHPEIFLSLSPLFFIFACDSVFFILLRPSTSGKLKCPATYSAINFAWLKPLCLSRLLWSGMGMIIELSIEHWGLREFKYLIKNSPKTGARFLIPWYFKDWIIFWRIGSLYSPAGARKKRDLGWQIFSISGNRPRQTGQKNAEFIFIDEKQALQINPFSPSKCFSQFRQMRGKRISSAISLNLIK